MSYPVPVKVAKVIEHEVYKVSRGGIAVPVTAVRAASRKELEAHKEKLINVIWGKSVGLTQRQYRLHLAEAQRPQRRVKYTLPHLNS